MLLELGMVCMDILLRNWKAWESFGISPFWIKRNDVMDDGSWHHLSLLCVGLLWRDSLLSRNIYITSLWLKYYVGEWTKKPIKPMAETITRKTKGKAKERPKDAEPAGAKEGRELVPLMVRRYLIHHPFNVIHMQTMKSKGLIVIGGLEQVFLTNAIFLSIAKVKAC